MNSKNFWNALGLIANEKFRCKVEIVHWSMNEATPWGVKHDYHFIFWGRSELECKAYCNYHRMEY